MPVKCGVELDPVAFAFGVDQAVGVSCSRACVGRIRDAVVMVMVTVQRSETEKPQLFSEITHIGSGVALYGAVEVELQRVAVKVHGVVADDVPVAFGWA